MEISELENKIWKYNFLAVVDNWHERNVEFCWERRTQFENREILQKCY